MAESTPRGCVSCDAVYSGELSCPNCGKPGEPLCSSCGSSELRYEATTDEVDCVGCGEIQGPFLRQQEPPHIGVSGV